jgi:hypothetical protein
MHMVNVNEYLDIMRNFKIGSISRIMDSIKKQQSYNYKVKCEMEKCKYQTPSITVKNYLNTKNLPKVLNMALNWNIASEDELKSIDIYDFLLSLHDNMRLSSIFDLGVDDRDILYSLKALICFVGKHYLTFIRHPASLSNTT